MGRHRVEARPGASGFRPDVEGLRGVAVLAVVLFHAGVPGTDGGYVGVDVFYVLSGFLITGLLLRDLDRHGRVRLADFWARRARRLLPAAVVVLLATVAAALVVLPPLRARSVAVDGVWAALYGGNVREALRSTDYLAATDPPSPLQHYWSLGVEEQFYVLWPLLVLAVAAWLGRRALPAVVGLVGLASLAGSVALTRVAQPWAFFSMPPRAWELAVGAGLALAAARLQRLPVRAGRALQLGGLAAVGLAVVALDERTAYPGTAALLPVLGAAAVVAGGAVAGAGVLGTRPLRAAGRVSYSWYLWHWPLLVLPAEALGRPLRLVEALALTAAGALLAAGTVVLVEDPVRYARALRLPRVALPAAAAATALAVGLPLAGAATLPDLGGGRSEDVRPVTALAPAGDPAAPPPDPADLVGAALREAVTLDAVPAGLTPGLGAAREDLPHPYGGGCHVRYLVTEAVACTTGGGATTVALVGDSHAVQWWPALDPAATARGWRLLSMTKYACPPLGLPVRSPALARAYRECGAWLDGAVERAADEGVDLVVLGSARSYLPRLHDVEVGGRAWLEALADTVRRFAPARVVVLGATPKLLRDAPSCLSDNLDAAHVCTSPRERAVDAGLARAERAAVEAAGGRYLDVADWACTPTACPAVVDGLLVYRDDNHFTTAYPRWLAPVLADALS